MTAINTNIKALVAQQALNVNERGLNQAMQQLSTGKRINSAADDAAGIAISNKMTSQVRGLNQAVRNANDGVSMVQTVDSAAEGVTNILQRMRELAIQAANGTNSTSDMSALNSEYADLKAEIGRIASNTTWNGFAVGNNASTAYSFQVGASGSQTISINLQNLAGSTAATGTITLSAVASAVAATIDTAANATTAIAAVDAALADVDEYRGDLGSKVNRLQYAADNATNMATQAASGRSRILDTDYAKATTDLAKAQIIQQAGTAMLAQANQSPYSVLALLK